MIFLSLCSVFENVTNCEEILSGNTTMHVIPLPAKIAGAKGYFSFTERTRLVYFFGNKEMQFAIDYFADRLRAATGYKLRVINGFEMPRSGFIFFDYIRDDSLGDEGYRLDIAGNRIHVT